MSIRIRPTVNINSAGAAMKIHNAAKAAIHGIADDIRKDCNMYAPKRRGTLISQSNTEALSGDLARELHWGVPYASYVYKGVSRNGRPLRYNKNLNENAGPKWCERAKQAYGSQWDKQAAKAVKGKYNGS